MTSIHQAIADLPPGENTADDQHRHKRMWTLTEVSSGCEDDRPASNGHLALEHSGDSCVKRRSGTNRRSGQVNSAYIEDAIVLDYTEDDDDDVFVSGAVATLSGFSENTVVGNRTEIIQSLGKVFITYQPKEQFELDVRHRRSVSNKALVGEGIPDFSDKLHRPDSLVVEDADVSNQSLDDDDKTELSPPHCKMKEVIVPKSDGISCNGARVLRLSSEKNVSDTEITENNRTSTSSENIRLSPLKIVGEFLFHTNKSTRLKEEVLDESCTFPANDGESEESHDCHNTIQRLKDSDTVLENGSVSHTCEATKRLDDVIT
jgi:hypothetical protein